MLLSEKVGVHMFPPGNFKFAVRKKIARLAAVAFFETWCVALDIS
jgi:hypothetical protein